VYMPVPASQPTVDPTVKEDVFLTGVVLVRDIKFSPYEEGSPGWSDCLTSYPPTSSQPPGYDLRFLEILGSAQEELILALYSGYSTLLDRREDPYRLYPEYTSDSKRFGDQKERFKEKSSPFASSHCRLVLLKDRLNDPEFLQQTIASLYLDQPEEDLSYRSYSYCENWPFDRSTPEAEVVRKQIESRKTSQFTPVIEPQAPVARPPSFLERFLKRVF
ncbi:MAG: hypothetical protein Q8Q92_03635, partial [bacterium]|nr:hypothetical protein [bacterium]